jgi:endonuclease/exonuclease/phosphatase family metal-dependent hydrolase
MVIGGLKKVRRGVGLVGPLMLWGASACSVDAGRGVEGLSAGACSFRVMSFNVRRGDAGDGRNHWRHRREAAASAIRGEKPDIVGLQEALPFQLEYFQDVLEGYAVLGRGRDADSTGGEHVAIMVRESRFSIDTAATFWFSETPEIAGSRHWGNRLPRICTWVRLTDRTTGDSLLCLNAHLDHLSRHSRRRSAHLLLRRAHELAGGAAVIVTGDFNAGEGSRCVGLITGMSRAPGLDTASVLPPMVDTYRIAKPSRRLAGTHHWFRGFRLGPKIDYIFAPSSARVHDARIVRRVFDGRYPSDHFPVVARISVGADDGETEAVR